MTALCLAAGMQPAITTVDRMLKNLSPRELALGKVSPVPNLALGHAWHNFLDYLGPPVSFPDGITVLVSGDIYDDDGLASAPAKLIADLYRFDQLHKVSWLNGSFCIAILDPPKGRVALITDRLASRSLFVWHDNKRLLASSRLLSLVREKIVPKRISKQGIAELLIFQRTIATHTQYEDIVSMPAAQVWIWEKGRRSSQFYYMHVTMILPGSVRVLDFPSDLKLLPRIRKTFPGIKYWWIARRKTLRILAWSLFPLR